MANYQGFPIEFPKCPICGSMDVLTERAMQAYEKVSGAKRENPFVSFERFAAPLTTPAKVAGLTCPMLGLHFDICAGCGMKRCIKAEIVDVPITMGQPSSGPGGAPGFRPPGARGPLN